MSRRSESATGPIRTLPLKVQLNAAQQQRRRRRIGWPLETAQIQRHRERERDGLADEWSVGKFEQAQCDALAVFLSEFQQAPIHLPFPVGARQLSCTLFSLLRAKNSAFHQKISPKIIISVRVEVDGILCKEVYAAHSAAHFPLLSLVPLHKDIRRKFRLFLSADSPPPPILDIFPWWIFPVQYVNKSFFLRLFAGFLDKAKHFF